MGLKTFESIDRNSEGCLSSELRLLGSNLKIRSKSAKRNLPNFVAQYGQT
jgi:hypothetical protein